MRHSLTKEAWFRDGIVRGRKRAWALPAGLILLLSVPLTPLANQQKQREPPTHPAHIVLMNGRIWTMEKRYPEVSAVAIRGSRIIGVGSWGKIRRLMIPGYTRVINLKGRIALPGFIDNHTHFAQAGRLLLGLNLLDVDGPEEFSKRVREAAGRLPEGAWLVGGDWGAYAQWAMGSTGSLPEKSESPPPVLEPDLEEEGPDAPKPVPEKEGEVKEEERNTIDEAGTLPIEKTPKEDPWPPLEGFLPTKELIDPVTGERPALISRFDRKVYLANSAALKAAGITAATLDPKGGLILRDAGGRPTGLLRGTAAEMVQQAIPPPPFEQRKAEALRALDEARRYGVTSIHDNISDMETLDLFQSLRQSGELTLRVWARVRLTAWEQFLKDYIRLFRVPQVNDNAWGDQFIRFGGLKGWVDGIMGNSSALFFDPYNHQPENRGKLRDIMYPEGNLYELIKGADQEGFTVTVHAIGDRANRILLDTYEKVFQENPERDRRFRVVHAQVLHPDDFKRFGELKLIAEVQPYHAIDDMRWMEERIGERARHAYAFKSLQDAGALLTFGTDWPGTNAAYYPINPLLSIYAAVTRKTLKGEPEGGWFPEERITIEDALRFYTINNAYAAFEESQKGSIKKGKIADLVVLDRDILNLPPEELLKTKVDYTIFGGKVLYDRVREERQALEAAPANPKKKPGPKTNKPN